MADLCNMYRSVFWFEGTTHKCSYNRFWDRGSVYISETRWTEKFFFSTLGRIQPGRDRLCTVESLNTEIKIYFLLLRECVDFFLLNQSTWCYRRYIVQFISGWDINMGGIHNRGWMDHVWAQASGNLHQMGNFDFWDISLENFFVYGPCDVD